MLEVLIKKSDIGLIKIMRDSRIFTTITFMIMSGIIMNFLQKGDTNQFWYVWTNFFFFFLWILLHFIWASRLISPVKVKLKTKEAGDPNINTDRLINSHNICSHDEFCCLNYVKDVRNPHFVCRLIYNVLLFNLLLKF